MAEDFNQFKVLGWGWYYLSTVLDDDSRYIQAWKLSTTMGEKDVEETLEMALKVSGLERARVRHRPQLLSDNGPAYLSNELKKFLKIKDIQHIRGAPYHPKTQGKMERWHRSIKNIVKLQNYYFPSELEHAISKIVEFYNHQRYHASLDNLTPTDICFGRKEKALTKRAQIIAKLCCSDTSKISKLFEYNININSLKKCLLTKILFCPISTDDMHFRLQE